MFRFIDSEECDLGSHHSVRNMCKWLAVSRSSYYDWKTRGESFTAARRRHTATMVVAVFEDSGRTYGYRRITAQLARLDHHVDREVVRSIMREQGLVAATPKRKHPLTTSASDATGIPRVPDRSRVSR
jgi:hypothetical protein